MRSSLRCPQLGYGLVRLSRSHGHDQPVTGVTDMKITVLYDKHGNILSTAVPAPEFSGSLHLEPRSGEHVMQVDAGDIGIKESSVADEKKGNLGNIVRSAVDKLKVDVKQHRLVLKKK